MAFTTAVTVGPIVRRSSSHAGLVINALNKEAAVDGDPYTPPSGWMAVTRPVNWFRAPHDVAA